MPIKHKVVESSDTDSFEQQLDKFVAQGYRIITSNAYDIAKEDRSGFYALLEKILPVEKTQEKIETDSELSEAALNILHPKRN